MRRLFSRCVFRKHLWPVLAIALLLVIALVVAEGWTRVLARGLCHNSPANCPPHSVGLVLGCSRTLANGHPNMYFTGRIQAAADLWNSGQVRGFIVSGDNRTRHYNEPDDMRAALVAKGVPAERIVCDYAGLCTYDSVARAHRIFGAKSLTIISQESHAERAVAIARHLGISAVALNAPLVPVNRPTFLKQWVRERAARVSMVFDFVTCRRPRHLGHPEPLPFPASS